MLTPDTHAANRQEFTCSECEGSGCEWCDSSGSESVEDVTYKDAYRRYGTIVADPPWNVLRPGGGTRNGQYHERGEDRLAARQQPYPTMSVDEIASLPVADWAAPRSHLYLWTVNRHVEDAYRVARAWGFTPSALLVWCKSPVGKGPGGLYSITTEYVLYAKRGAEPRRMVVPTTWWNWPRRGQSVKPEQFYDLVESVAPGPYLELFARRRRLGWDVWGNEVESDMELIA